MRSTLRRITFSCKGIGSQTIEQHDPVLESRSSIYANFLVGGDQFEQSTTDGAGLLNPPAANWPMEVIGAATS